MLFVVAVPPGTKPIGLKDMLDAAKLEKELLAAAEAYYTDGTSPLSDAEYDTKLEQLRAMRPQSKLFTSVGSAPSGAKIYKHAYPVGSQEKLKSYEELETWCDKVEALDKGPEIPFVVQWKLDGITAVLTYKNGKLIRALTRGDGTAGEDITRNVKLMRNVKASLPGFTGVLRGEIVLPISRFELVFKPLGFKNPRNTTAGKTRDEKADAMTLSQFEIIYFDVMPPMESEEAAMLFLDAHGLDHVDYEIVRNKVEVWDSFNGFETRRPNYDIDCDGVVVKANNTSVQAELGISSDMRPHGQKCLKFQAAGGVTTILDVVHSVGHTGELYPTAKLEPVDVCGVTISSCTLHNYEEVKRLGVAIGDQVEIIRAGDVIPKIIKLVHKGKNRKQIEAPLLCPACQWSTVRDGQHIFCENGGCPGQELRRLGTWVKKRDIKYLGDEVLAALYATGVHSPRDLYGLSLSGLESLELSGRRVGGAATRIIEEIEKSKTATLSDFLGSLGMNKIGRRQVELMMESCQLKTVQDFLNVTVQQLEAAPGFAEGGTKATAIVAALKQSRPLIKKMLEVITIKEEEKIVVPTAKASKATGKSFCFTGALPSGATRDEATADLLASGGIAWDSVKKGLDYLVIADPASKSSKAVKARDMGVTLISEADFRKLLK